MLLFSHSRRSIFYCWVNTLSSVWNSQVSLRLEINLLNLFTKYIYFHFNPLWVSHLPNISSTSQPLTPPLHPLETLILCLFDFNLFMNILHSKWFINCVFSFFFLCVSLKIGNTFSSFLCYEKKWKYSKNI